MKRVMAIRCNATRLRSAFMRLFSKRKRIWISQHEQTHLKKHYCTLNLQETDASIRHIICWPIIEWNDPRKKLITIHNFEWTNSKEYTKWPYKKDEMWLQMTSQVELKSHGKIKWPNWRISSVNAVLTSRLFHSWNKEIGINEMQFLKTEFLKTKTFSEAAIADSQLSTPVMPTFWTYSSCLSSKN